MKTMTIRKNVGSKLSPGWKMLEVIKASYGDWEGTKFLDVWFKDLPESANGRVYAKVGKDGEEFSIAQVFRFANAGLTEALTSANGDKVVQFDDTADNLVGKSLWVYMYKEGDYSRILKQFAPTPFENQVETFTEEDVEYWKTRAIKYYTDYVMKDNTSNGFVEEAVAPRPNGTGGTVTTDDPTADLPF